MESEGEGEAGEGEERREREREKERRAMEEGGGGGAAKRKRSSSMREGSEEDGRVARRPREGDAAQDGELQRDIGLRVRLTKKDGVLSLARSRVDGDSMAEGLNAGGAEPGGRKELDRESSQGGPLESKEVVGDGQNLREGPVDGRKERAQLAAPDVTKPRTESVIGAKVVSGGEEGGRMLLNGGDFENISQGQQVPPTEVPGATSLPAAMEESAPVREPSRLEVYRIPCHAGWFAWNSIHKIEKQKLPEFFNGKSAVKNPKSYKEYRDAIINKYRENPSRALTFTEVRRTLVGDVNALRRIFEFLDHWGLINFHAPTNSETEPPKWAGTPPTLVETEPTGIRVVAPVIDPTKGLFEFRPPTAGKGRHTAVSTGQVAGTLLLTRQNAYGPSAAEAAVANAATAMKGPRAEFHCNSCGADCTRRRFHCQKQADFDLCPSCFANGRFGAGMKSSDFILMDSPEEGQPADSEEWSDQETLLLLEGLELYGDNWNEIAEHVATKTKAQCILHFIRLPIEDPFLEDMEGRVSGTTSSKAAEGGSNKTGFTANGGIGDSGRVAGEGEGRSESVTNEQMKEVEEQLTPFADAANPVMAQVAFLAAMVGPQVAAAAAQAALTALLEEDPSTAAELESGLLLEDAPNPAPAPREAASAVSAVESKEKSHGILPGSSDSAGQDGMEVEEGGKLAEGKLGSGTAPDCNKDPLDKAQPPTAAGGGRGPSALRVRAAAASALAAAAVKAKLLADQEEREIQRLVANVIENQLKKLELKLQHFDSLEDVLQKEKEQLERQRQQLYAERVRLAASKASTAPADNASLPTAMHANSGRPLANQGSAVPVGDANNRAAFKFGGGIQPVQQVQQGLPGGVLPGAAAERLRGLL